MKQAGLSGPPPGRGLQMALSIKSNSTQPRNGLAAACGGDARVCVCVCVCVTETEGSEVECVCACVCVCVLATERKSENRLQMSF